MHVLKTGLNADKLFGCFHMKLLSYIDEHLILSDHTCRI